MKRNKNILKKFYYVNYDNLEEVKKYLEDMAAIGWMFEKYDGIRMQFQKCEPRDLNFAVEIFDKTSTFATYCNEKNMEYIEYCEAAGWNYISSYTFLQFFYSEDKNLTPIETDEKMKLKSIWKAGKYERVSNGIVLPLLGILFIFENLPTPVFLLSSFSHFSITFLWIVLVIGNLIQLFFTYVWYFVSKNKVENGEKIKKRRQLPVTLRYLLLGGTFVLWAGSGIFAYVIAGGAENLMLSGVILLTLLFLVLYYKLDSISVKKKVSPSGRVGNIILISFLLMNAITGFAIVFSGFNEHNYITYSEKPGEMEERYADDILYYFDDNGNLVKQPHGKEQRQKAQIETSHEDGRFIIQLDEYAQSPFEEETGHISVEYVICRSSFHKILDYLTKLAGKRRFDYEWQFVNLARQNRIYQNGAICVYEDYDSDKEQNPFCYLIRREQSVINLRSSKKISKDALQYIANDREAQEG